MLRVSYTPSTTEDYITAAIGMRIVALSSKSNTRTIGGALVTSSQDIQFRSGLPNTCVGSSRSRVVSSVSVVGKVSRSAQFAAVRSSAEANIDGEELVTAIRATVAAVKAWERVHLRVVILAVMCGVLRVEWMCVGLVRGRQVCSVFLSNNVSRAIYTGKRFQRTFKLLFRSSVDCHGVASLVAFTLAGNFISK